MERQHQQLWVLPSCMMTLLTLATVLVDNQPVHAQFTGAGALAYPAMSPNPYSTPPPCVREESLKMMATKVTASHP